MPDAGLRSSTRRTARSSDNSPYTSAFLRLAREPNLPIEKLFKRVRLEVNHSTEGEQTPWESSSLTSEFYFFGDTAIAATRAAERGPVVQMASNLPMRSVRQAYDYVLSEDSPVYYQEFIQMFPRDPLCERVRILLGHLLQATAWHEAVLTNSPLAYKTFYDKYAGSPYALSALKLQSQPKALPLLQPTHLIVPQHLEPTLKFTGTSKYNLNIKPGGAFGQVRGNPGVALGNSPTKIVTMPAPTHVTPNGGNIGTVGKSLPGDTVGKVQSTQDLKGDRFPSRITDHHQDPIVDHHQDRIADHHPEQTFRQQSRMEDSGMRRFNDSPSRFSRQPSFTPSRMGSGMGGGGWGGGMRRGMGGGGFGSHFAMGGGGHGGGFGGFRH